MKKEWICCYCGQTNPGMIKFCPGCTSKRPEPDEQCPGGGQEENEAESPAGQEGTDFVKVPRQGEIVGGLFRLSDQASNGEIGPHAFKQKIASLSGDIQDIFHTICSELGGIDTDADEYRDFTLDLMHNVQYMFDLSLKELALFPEDGDNAHLRYGRMLAQRAELEYIDIMKMLRADAALNPFSGVPNVLGGLGSLIMEGKLGREDYLARLQDLENLLDRQIQNALKLVKEGMARARKFDGTDDGILHEAIRTLSTAGDLLARAVINLHNPEEVKKSVEEMVRKTVETMEARSTE